MYEGVLQEINIGNKTKKKIEFKRNAAKPKVYFKFIVRFK